MHNRKLLRAQIQLERFLQKVSRRNDPLEAFRKTKPYLDFEQATAVAIRKQITFLSTHLNDIGMWGDEVLPEHQIEAKVSTYLDRHMPKYADIVAEETVYNCLFGAFVWSCKGAYERIGVKILRKSVDYTVNFDLTNQDYIDALNNDASYLLNTKSKGYDQTTKDRMVNIVKKGRLNNDTIDEVSSDLNAQVDSISSVRSFMIANTETARAFGDANQAFRTENAIPQKQWVTAGGNPCPICITNEEQGPINSEDTFDSGDADVPAHINDECYVDNVGLDLSTMSNDELDALVLWDGS